MDNTSSDTSSHHRLSSALPSEAHQLLATESHELARREHEKKSLHAAEVMLADELASALKNEKVRVDREGTEILQDFKRRDLTDLLKKESAETDALVETTKNRGLPHVQKAAKILTDAVLADDFLSPH